MKKYLSIALLTISLAVLSGCSSMPNIDSASTGSIWKTENDGVTWEVKNQSGAKKTVPLADVLSIAVSPFDPNVALFGTRSNGIIKTEDGGESLETTNFTSAKVYGLEISPIDKDTIYASGVVSGRGKIFKSADFGKNWDEIYTSAANGPLVISLEIDRNNPDVIFITTNDNQLIKTSDGGRTWKNLFMAPSPILKTAVNRGDSSFVYFITDGSKVYRSKNGGESPEDISKQALTGIKGQIQINALITDPYNPGWVYIGGSMGILRSKNFGDTWEKIGILNDPNRFPVKTIVISPVNPQDIIYSAAQAVYKSTDDGIHWATSQLVSSQFINVMKYSSSNTNIIYLGLSNVVKK